jgi:DNA-binding CsgD family transcriptional regulator
MLAIQERVYHAHLDAGEDLAAARAAFWLGFTLLGRGELGHGGGWLSRSQRLVDVHAKECVEQGYLLLPAAQRHLGTSEFGAASACAERAARIGERFGEVDLIAFARNLLGRALLGEGRIESGLALLDEALLPASAGELSPAVTGIVYCSAIASCQRVLAFDRVREWTAALSSWCEANPQLGLFTGPCLAYRAEVMQMNGLWSEAVEEARRAVQRCVRDFDKGAAGRAHYQEAEIHRLRGQFAHAESAYRDAGRAGFDPQPGLALLRLARGDCAGAASFIRRVIGATSDSLMRTRFLPAYVEILLAAGDLEEARAASGELQRTAATFNTEVLAAMAHHACAAVSLVEGNPQAALDPARRSFRVWQQLDAPYLAARLRVLLARACFALEDNESAQMELECAREVFKRLGARPDVAVVTALEESCGAGARSQARSRAHGLTERELQVLRLVAKGRTNKAIARELALSEKTVDRHMSNIFVKISVSSRAAATAFAYERQLL